MFDNTTIILFLVALWVIIIHFATNVILSSVRQGRVKKGMQQDGAVFTMLWGVGCCTVYLQV
jgi:hypothetical protein